MSFNDCLSKPDQDELVAIRDGMGILQWRTGDIANRNYADQQDRYSFSYICSAVGFYVGKSRSTIEKWARVSAFYSEEREGWRTAYEGLLSFEHLAVAMTYADWETRLERAAYGGRFEEPQSVDQMVAPTLSSRPDAPENFPASPTAVFSYDTAIPSVQILGQPDNTIQTILGLIGRLADSLSLNDERRAKVYRAMQLLSEAMGVDEKQQ